MQNSSRRSLSLLPCLVALALLPARFAKADTVFDVSGSAVNDSGGMLDSCANNATCPFSGTLTVNVTSTTTNPFGSVDAIDITFPGLTAIDAVFLSEPLGSSSSDWMIGANNSSNDSLFLFFTTTQTPASLVGFDGGTIVGVAVVSASDIYGGLSGNITPVPEPSSLGLLTVALLAFAGIIRLRKRKPVVTR